MISSSENKKMNHSLKNGLNLMPEITLWCLELESEYGTEFVMSILDHRETNLSKQKAMRTVLLRI